MRFAFAILAAALACGSVLAQAPAGVTSRPSQEQNPNASGGAAQAKGEMKAEAKGKGAGASAGATAVMGHKAMDVNSDGFVTRKEWDASHGKMWGSMKGEKRGVPWAAVEAGMTGSTPKWHQPRCAAMRGVAPAGIRPGRRMPRCSRCTGAPRC